ncbi:winged helix-turn-helix domain-containing protein [Pantoea sp. C2G6]|uniref:winged helix-turn-helix domain-containing protein n=1 Tax=Pantoea sp. C2G6 TaxID=3243084 RepID=UPI003ED9F52C
MLNHYIINGFVEFQPAVSTLRNLNEPEKVVVLNSPAGRCLLLLIERIDTIVTQHEFMEIVWERNGMMVTPNTFYQNISILRKGLKKAGLEEDLVVTIPRVGLTLASGTQIKKRSAEEQPEMSHEDAHFMDTDAQMQEPREKSDNSGSGHIATLASIPGPPLQIRPAKITMQKKSPSFSLWKIGLLVIVLLLVQVSLNIKTDNRRQYFRDYSFLATTSGCHIYIADKNATPDDKTRTLSLIENFKKKCSDYPWIYVTHYLMLPRISIIRCNKKMDELNTCISEYYFRGLNNGD